MSLHRVTDLRHLLDAEGQPAPAVRKLAVWLGSIVECVTAGVSEGRWEPIPVACRECRRVEDGRVAARWVGPGIEWLCTQCRASGTLLGWKDTTFDLSEVSVERGDDADRNFVFVRLDELEVARTLVEARDLRRLLAFGVADEGHWVLIFDDAELLRLLACLRAQVGAVSGKPRYAAERFIGRCDAALGMAGHKRAERGPTLH